MARIAPSWSILFALLVGGVAVGQSSRAQEIEVREGYEEITPVDFSKLPPYTPEGRKYTLHYVKFNKLFGEDLKLFGGFHNGRAIRSHVHGLLKIEDTRLRAKLIANLKANLDSDGQTLTPKRSNIQVFGVGKRIGESYVLLVNRVHLLDEFKVRFQARYSELSAGDAQVRLDLVATIQRAVRFFPEDLNAVEDLVATLKKEARTAEYDQLEALPGGLEAHVKFAKRHEDIELLGRAWKHEGLSEEDRARVGQVLRDDLNARLLLGTWYAFDDYKKRLGFRLSESADWIPRERVELLRVAADEKKKLSNLMLVPQVPQQLLADAAKKGDVVAGMPKDMVVAAKRGFPVRVTRVREKVSHGTLMWAQWVMEDGTKVYFRNGFAFKKEAADQ